jgi:DNA-binding response OmpR family regulator
MTQPDLERPKKKIAVVEADEDFLHLIQVALADCRAEFVSASSGRAGLELIRQEQPDLVILDLALPDMSGWEVFIQLRCDTPSDGSPPVIILADVGTRIDRTFSLLVAQVNDYQLKPFLPSRLRHSVRHALKLDQPERREAAGQGKADRA